MKNFRLNSSFMLCLLCLLCLLSLQAFAGESSAELRFLSNAIRDKSPTVQEAKDFAAGKSLDAFVEEWLGSADHKQRVFRYFDDLFGVTKNIFIAPEEFALKKNTQGIYYLSAPGYANCSLTSGSVEVQASEVWWLDDSAPSIRMCTDTQNNFITKGTWNTSTWRDCLNLNAQNGFFHPECGCGPDQLLCWPEELKKDVWKAVRFEFPNRALQVYERNLSWRDLLGGNQFFGNRLLYHVYIYQSRIVSRALGQNTPTAADMARLKGLPLGQTNSATPFLAFPDPLNPRNKGSVPNRSGIVTSPGFLRQHNNFRSRIRALTEKLLCQDVSPAQNTDGIATFVNDDLSAFDKSHGSKESCSGCHFAMDNQGSTLLGWDQLGNFNYYEDLKQSGHSFGASGTGPEFLMDSYLERGPGFYECMAKRAFEDFSGQSWDSLSKQRKDDLTEKTKQGPRALVQSVIKSPEMRCLRSSGGGMCQPLSTTPQVSFDADIKPILAAKCSGSGCHSTDSVLGPSYQFIDSQAAFRGINASRILDASMPPPSSGKTLTEEEKTLILNFLGR